MTRRIHPLIGVILLIPIVVYAYIGRFSRLMADDFCYAINARNLGLSGAIPFYYDNWFGRLTQTVGALVGTSLGVPFAEVFPALLLVLWLLGLLWLWRELGALLHVDERMAWVVGACVILYGTLAGTPQIFHSLYWISAVFPFTFPLVLATYFAALVVRAGRLGRAQPLAVLAVIGLSLVAGLSSEPFALAFCGAVAGSIVGLLVFRPQRESPRAALVLLIAALVTASIALVIMVAAPGNTLRQGLFTPTHAPVALVLQSLTYALASIFALTWLSPPAILLALFLPAVIAYRQPVTAVSKRMLRIGIGLALLFGYGLIVLTTVPGIYATSTAPPARALIIPQFVLICTCALVGWLIGLHLRKAGRRPPWQIVVGLAVLLLVIGPLLTAVQMIGLVPKLNDYAQAWDQRDAQIVAAAAAGQETLVVAPLAVDVASLTGLDRIGTDASAFTNACAASYYGLKSLTASG